MATIDKRIAKNGKITWRVQVRLKGAPTQSATFNRKTDADLWAQTTEAAIRDGRHFKTAEAKRHTLGEMIERYTAEVLPQKKDGKNQARQLNWWKDNLGTRTLAEITPVLIAEFRDSLAKGATVRGESRSPATVNRYLAVLSHAFTIAVKEWGWLDDNPLRKVRKLKEPRGRVRFLSEEERDRLLKACRESQNPDLYLVVVLAISTGARRMELWGLRWRQIDLPRGLIILEDTKNNERRSVPLQGPALELMRDRARLMDTDLVFPSKSDPSRPVDFSRAFETACRRAGIDNFRWHDLRHTAASYLAMNGATLAEIAAVLGHKTLAMVKRYSHLTDSHTADVVKRMNEQIFGNRRLGNIRLKGEIKNGE